MRHVDLGEGADAEGRIGAGIVDVGVDPGRDLVAAAGEVDDGFIALDRDIHAEADRVGSRSDVVEHVVEAVDAVRDRRDQLARSPLRAREQFLDGAEHGVPPPLAIERAQPLGADVIGVALRAQVAAHLFRDAHIAENDPQQILVELALADELHRQDADAFLIGFGDALHRLRARRRAADIDVMRGVDHRSPASLASSKTGVTM